MMTELSKPELKWYRDQGRGQEAAEAVGATMTTDGAWPVATVQCSDTYHADCMWRYLLSQFGVNAMQHQKVSFISNNER